MGKQMIVAIVLGLMAVDAGASLARFDFSGAITSSLDGDPLNIPIDAWVLLDTSVPDVNPGPNGRFPDAVVDLSVSVNDVTFGPSQFVTGEVSVFNDDDESRDDSFWLLLLFESADSESVFLGLQLKDSTRTVFDSDRFPVSLQLSQFDGYSVDDSAGTGLFYAVVGFGGQGPLSSALLQPVPLPAPAWLLLMALVALGVRKS